MFGGWNAESVVARLDISTRTWTQVGSLNQGRRDHAVVVRSNDFVVVGGCSISYYTSNCEAAVTTERCEMQNDEMICLSVDPKLTSFSQYAEAMLVDQNYCVNN